MARLSLWLPVSSLLLGAGLGGGTLWIHHVRANHWRDWPHVDATVIAIEEGEGSHGETSYRPVYRYRVAGARVDEADPMWSSSVDVHQGDHLPLAVNPKDAHDYVGEPGWGLAYGIPLLFGGVFTLIALLLFRVRASGTDAPEEPPIEVPPPAPTPPPPDRWEIQRTGLLSWSLTPPLGWLWPAFTLGALVSLALGMRAGLRHREAWRDWPHVDATVERLKADRPYDTRDTGYAPVLAFDFNGQRRVVVDEDGYQHAPSVPVGGKVELAVNPAHPDTFERARQPEGLWVGLAATAIFAFMAWGFRFLYAALYLKNEEGTPSPIPAPAGTDPPRPPR